MIIEIAFNFLQKATLGNFWKKNNKKNSPD